MDMLLVLTLSIFVDWKMSMDGILSALFRAIQVAMPMCIGDGACIERRD
jgi:hypothetical protein